MSSFTGELVLLTTSDGCEQINQKIKDAYATPLLKPIVLTQKEAARICTFITAITQDTKLTSKFESIAALQKHATCKCYCKQINGHVCFRCIAHNSYLRKFISEVQAALI